VPRLYNELNLPLVVLIYRVCEVVKRVNTSQTASKLHQALIGFSSFHKRELGGLHFT
jgi:hypothetical protein